MKRYLILLALCGALHAQEPVNVDNDKYSKRADQLAQLANERQKSKPALPDTFKIDINVASPAYMVMLPGIGEKTAQKIIAGRPYKDIVDLVSRKNGVGAYTAAKIEQYLVWEE